MTKQFGVSIRRGRLGALLASLAFIAVILPGAAAAAAQAPITFYLQVGVVPTCLSGFATGGSMIDIVWRDSGGALIGQGTGEAHPANGYWEVCDLGDGTHALLPGNRIRATVGSYTRNYVVPNLTVDIDRVNDIYNGTGPAGRTIKIWYPAGLLADYEEGRSIRVGQDGHWSHDPHPYADIILGVSVYWTSPNGDSLWLYASPPELDVTIGSARVTGTAEPFASVAVAIANAPAASGVDVAGDWGTFDVRLRNGNGNARQVAAGDHLVAPDVAADANWIVPDSFATADALTDQVTGWCEDTGLRSELAIVNVRRTNHIVGRAWIGVDADGQFSFDFSGQAYPGFNPANVKHGDRLVVSCMLTTGDWVSQSFMVP